jgi:hypothetical protein
VLLLLLAAAWVLRLVLVADVLQQLTPVALRLAADVHLQQHLAVARLQQLLAASLRLVLFVSC